MKEFKVGDKVMVETRIIGEDKFNGQYQMKIDANAWIFWVEKDKVHSLTADSINVHTKTYEDGLREAWELAKKIICNIEYGGLHTSELEQIFGCAEFDDVLKNYTPQEAAAKIAEWEERQEIHVGDVLLDKISGDREVVVSNVHDGGIYVIWPDGSCGECEAENFAKTGRTIDIEGLLAQIGGAE